MTDNEILVAFDDGAEITLDIRSRDLLAFEEEFGMGDQFSSVEGVYAIAYAALKRRRAAGQDVPDVGSLDDLKRAADVERIGGEGKVSDPAPTTG